MQHRQTDAVAVQAQQSTHDDAVGQPRRVAMRRLGDGDDGQGGARALCTLEVLSCHEVRAADSPPQQPACVGVGEEAEACDLSQSAAAAKPGLWWGAQVRLERADVPTLAYESEVRLITGACLQLSTFSLTAAPSISLTDKAFEMRFTQAARIRSVRSSRRKARRWWATRCTRRRRGREPWARGGERRPAPRDASDCKRSACG